MDSQAGKFTFGMPPAGSGDAFAAGVAGIPTISPREFGRILVVLGANGAGKSRLLASLAATSPDSHLKREVVYVEGGRSLVPGPRGAVVPSKSGQNAKLAKRLIYTFNSIEQERQDAVARHKESLFKWDQENNGKPKPIMPKSGFDRVHEVFSSLFPGLSLRAEVESATAEKAAVTRWFCKSTPHEYDVSRMSDGEKQVLCLLCDVGELSPKKSLIIVDEPELNLHPTLAMNVWNAIEQMRSESVFVYATHSLSFAMRPNVTDVIILGRAKTEPIHLRTPFDWDSEELEPFLGAIPAVVTSGKLMAVEGNDKSFDHDFFQWIVGPRVTIASLGSCDYVRGAVKHNGVWKFSGEAKIFGVIDRDFRTDEQLATIAADGCHVLDFHEAESYLCHPAILAAAAKHSGKPAGERELLRALALRCESKLVPVAFRRAVAASQIRLSLGPQREQIAAANLDAALQLIGQLADEESPRANDFKAKCEERFQIEYDRCKQAVENQNISELLALFPGKEMLRQMAWEAGFEKPDRLLNSLRNNVPPDSFPELVKIRESARAKFG